jgi:hyperosmotically inducible periplasmic protein
VAMLGCNRVDDAALVTAIKSKLATELGVTAASINVDSTDGLVTLQGAVSSAAEKSRAEEATKTIAGVKSVTNNLTVKPPIVNATPPQVSPDMKLKSDVTAALTKYGITGVTVDVANGEVTLSGDIPRAKLQDALKAANESHPKKVNNKLNIKK